MSSRSGRKEGAVDRSSVYAKSSGGRPQGGWKAMGLWTAYPPLDALMICYTRLRDSPVIRSDLPSRG
jgi:hypothetical protein